MSQNLNLGSMDTTQKFSVSNQINSNLQYTNIKSDSFTVDMDPVDTIQNSRIILQRNHSRKGSQIRGGEKKMNSCAEKERDGSILVPNSSSPRAALVGSSSLEKPIVVTVGATTSHPINHQITITTLATTAAASTITESKLRGKRYGFKRSSSFWTIDPRRILFFFATLSSMGTMLLIYFTLSVEKCLKLE